MSGRDDLIASFKAIMAEKRRALGEPPTPEELLAYRDGRLSAEERERLERKIDAFPEAARALLDLAAFPEVEPSPEIRVPTDKEIGAKWEGFRQRLDGATVPAAPPGPALAAPLQSPRRWRMSSASLRRAASILLVTGLAGTTGFFLGRAGQDRPGALAVNLAITELEPVTDDAARSTVQTVRWPPRAEELVLVLSLLDTREYPEYQIEVFDAGGGRLTSRQGLRPDMGMFSIGFRRGDLGSGEYRLALSGLAGTQTVPLASYELRLAVEE